MGERTIAALGAASVVGVGRASAVRHSDRSVPVAELLASPRAGSLLYGMAKVDVWGVVSNRAVVAGLGWTAGDCLTIALVDGSVVVNRDPDGVFEMGAKPYVVLPVVVRRRSGLRAGQQVLLVADPHHDVLVIHPLTALDAMITAYHAALTTGGDDR